MTNFKEKTLKQIRLWAWLAAALPMISLAGIFFVWAYGHDSWIEIMMITGSTIMFSVAVAWWWWAIHIFRNLLNLWDDTGKNLLYVIENIREVRKMVQEQIESDRDK